MAITQIYVDPAINAASGSGTIGDPYGDLQHALNTVTRDATNGNQFNIKAGTAEVLAASLTLATYGTPTDAAPLVLRGYTSAADDGGRGVVDCGGNTMFTPATLDYITLVDLELHSFGDNHGVYLDAYVTLHNCLVHKGASSPVNKFLVRLGANSRVTSSYVHSPGSGTLGCIGISGVTSLVMGNYVVSGADSIYGIYSTSSFVFSNVVSCAKTTAIGIEATGGGVVMGNMTRNSTAGTASGIVLPTNTYLTTTVINNIVSGWSGAGGAGIRVTTGDPGHVGYNAFYNCTSTYVVADEIRIDDRAKDVSLGADPFTDAANGDFSLTETAKTALRSLGWPASYLGAHANSDPHITIGAMQYGPAVTAGGGGPVIGNRIVRGLGVI